MRAYDAPRVHMHMHTHHAPAQIFESIAHLVGYAWTVDNAKKNPCGAFRPRNRAPQTVDVEASLCGSRSAVSIRFLRNEHLLWDASSNRKGRRIGAHGAMLCDWADEARRADVAAAVRSGAAVSVEAARASTSRGPTRRARRSKAVSPGRAAAAERARAIGPRQVVPPGPTLPPTPGRARAGISLGERVRRGSRRGRRCHPQPAL